MAFHFENTKPSMSNDELLADIKAVAAKLSRGHLTQRVYRTHGSFSTTAIKSRFGSWNKAVTAASLHPHQLRDIPIDDLFNNLMEVWTHLGRQPRKREMVQPLSRYTHHPYVRQFGGWLQEMKVFVDFASQSAAEFMTTQSEQRTGRGPREPSLRLRFMVMRRDRFACRYCGRSPATVSGLELHVDHIVPWAEGGATTIDNLQTLCMQCNLGKANLPHVGGG